MGEGKKQANEYLKLACMGRQIRRTKRYFTRPTWPKKSIMKTRLYKL